jgi:hypothetical protein
MHIRLLLTIVSLCVVLAATTNAQSLLAPLLTSAAPPALSPPALTAPLVQPPNLQTPSVGALESTQAKSEPFWMHYSLRLQQANVTELNAALATGNYPALSGLAFGVDYGFRHWFGDVLMDVGMGFGFSGSHSSGSLSQDGVRSTLAYFTAGGDVGYRVWQADGFSLYPTLGIRGELQSLQLTERSQSRASVPALGSWNTASVQQTTERTLRLSSADIIPVLGLGAEYRFTMLDTRRCGCDGTRKLIERDAVVFVHASYMMGGIISRGDGAGWNMESVRVPELPNAFSQGVSVRVGFGFSLNNLRSFTPSSMPTIE